MNRRRAGIGWATAIVVVLTALAGTAGTTAAMGADDPKSPTAASTEGAAPAQDSPSATDSNGSSTNAAPNAVATTATTGPTAPTTSAEPTATATPTTCPLCPPGHFTAVNGSRFNHPFTPGSASHIRNYVTRIVKSVPSGGTIRLALFSLNDMSLANALIAAVNRDVSVQIVGNNHNITNSIPGLPPSPSFKKLVRVLGSSRTEAGVDPDRVSFARICHASCRGHGGNVHYKMFLFSSAGDGSYDPATGREIADCASGQVSTPTDPCGGQHWITMMGSPNLTTRAAYGQWNHLDTYVNKATYDQYMLWFKQMKADSPRAHPYERVTAGGFTSWTFPKPGTTASNDPLMKGLNQVRCKGVAGGYGRNGRTLLRMGAYTFFDDRGRWISKKVRSLWNSGCDVAIEYAIMGDKIKRLLYSPSGRGRIPMRQVVTFKRNGDIDAYDHAKWFAVNGNYGGDGSSKVVFTGTTNISDLGFRSDDTGQVWKSADRVDAYLRDFSQLWHSSKAHVPSPTSRLNARIGSPQLTLGQGRYAAFEPE